MTKYDALLDMTYDNSAHTKLLKSIRPGSLVLEFGPAAGVMTRYMKEELDCKVYIVEIDADAYASAREYAAAGYLGDATLPGWEEEFSGVSFDYVLFADVLEHVYDPKALINRAQGLLAKDGVILLSVPNIAHNSIIIDLLRNRFDYRPVGLLDESHIRFFTYYTLLEMLAGLGLVPVVQDAIYMDPPDTEMANSLADVMGSAEALRTKDFERVYQFVFHVMKKSYCDANSIEVTDNIVRNESFFQGLVLFDTGEGFPPDAEPQLFDYSPEALSVTISLPPDTRRVLIWPTTTRRCVINNVRIETDKGPCAYVCNGNTIGNYIVFLESNAHIIATLPPEPVDWIRLDCRLAFYEPEDFLSLFESFIEFKALAERADAAAVAAIAAANENAREAVAQAAESRLALAQATEHELAKTSEELAQAHADYNRLISSASWRVTRPLRWLKGLLRPGGRTV